MDITFDNTVGSTKATTLVAVIAAVLAGNIRPVGNKKLIRIAGVDCKLDTATVTDIDLTAINYTALDGDGVPVPIVAHTNLTAIVAALEAGKLTVAGTKKLLRIGNNSCDLSTAVVPG